MSFRIIRDEIAKVPADAIVSTAGPGQLCFEDIEAGQAGSVPADDLPEKYVIYTVCPVWNGGNSDEFEVLRSCYENSLKLALKLGCKSIAFPIISAGIYGFPKAEALKIAVSAFSDFLAEEDMEIILVALDREPFVLSGEMHSGVEEFIDKNYVPAHTEPEYRDEETNCLDEEACDMEEIRSDSIKAERKPRRRFFGSRKDKTACLREMSSESFMGAAAESHSMKMFSLDDRVKHLGDTWQESLLKIIDDKGYTDIEVYKRANIDRKLFSKIRSNSSYQPKKITAVAFALALELNLDDTKDFIGRAGYAFSPSSIFDLIIEYFIEQGIYDLYTINLALFEHDQPILGA